MTNLTRTILYSISLICFYIILSIGLECFPKVGMSKNASNINQVSLNLSYSYIAGLIFYFFTSSLPNKIMKQKLKPVIDLKVNDIAEQICSYIQTFNKEKINCKIYEIDLKKLELLLKKITFEERSYYSKVMGNNMNNIEFINLTKSKIITLIDSLIIYKEYLDSDKILSLEKIKSSEFFNLLNLNINNQTGKIYYSSDILKQKFIAELNLIIIELKILNK